MNGIKSFVRRTGQITRAQERAIGELSRYIISSEEKELIHFDTYFSKKNVVVEIGFGMGLATYQIAQANPQTGYLGFEVYPAGVGKLLLAIEEHQLKNLYIVQDDAVACVPTMIADATLAGVHLFYPDPWPKKRHHKRRILQKEFIHLLASKLKVGGYLYIVTDWQEYAEEILARLMVEPLLKNRYDDYAEPQSWRPMTRFNEKANEAGRSSWELFFTRI
ncbi:tRNA (guanosine(46)-N7)-methyltransferase TrmB [Entomospira culicis]|uniref:tRNA (guanine-N(7)-)-methyltransferase n=1 Tax=Entomospira culicis TaxID=2719989 RepID=A0A968GGP3_9SPIO|nr:tRNA (guanosine(46)-N7)-methyltransferase TrmB [Entomospira culicis]NIZ19347.1 tRNA (guanosine(46)-N7)-methyltransferase TrmB [Entomospira culicis]NIZ69748.1 tRNA (guanosine(46)-N7)-methyltransferase TrmB [Entomospira culicis]WDI36859.1 tRNA (guanosine(46)-N7)-methyltransferase TrmB [Entomospira culicis]WDI38488.1 tRNA (guanosine(46)-N7)-methyltransferase TrmB [Entomospira culicis]